MIYMAHGFTRIFTRVAIGIVGLVMGNLHAGEAILHLTSPSRTARLFF